MNQSEIMQDQEGMPGAEYNVIVRKVFDDEEEGVKVSAKRRS